MKIGYVPKIFKIGKQTPVFKDGEISVVNFRPITVCNCLSKILEKVVRIRIERHVKECNILTPSQYGFRKKLNTGHAMINLLETTLSGLENGLKTGSIYLDISKAFDAVPHCLLLRKLEYFGIRDRGLMWFESYLTDRTQYVSVRNKSSKNIKVHTEFRKEEFLLRYYLFYLLMILLIALIYLTSQYMLMIRAL